MCIFFVKINIAVQGELDAGYVRGYLAWSIVNLFCGWDLLELFPLDMLYYVLKRKDQE